MLARRILTAALGLFVAASLVTIVVQEAAGTAPSRAPDATNEAAREGKVLVVTYFHGNRRCATCNRIEAYAREAIEEGFPAQVASGRIAWRTLNYDDETNALLRDRYSLYTGTLVLSDVRGGKERDWLDLDGVWMHVGDKPAFLAYVREEARAMLEAGP
jgi:hypothetical protein